MALKDDDEIAYTIEECSKKLKLHPNTLYAMVADKRIPHKKIGKRILFPKDALVKWLNSDLEGEKENKNDSL